MISLLHGKKELVFSTVGLSAFAAFFLTASACAAAPSHPFPAHTAYFAGVILPQVAQPEIDASVARFYDAWKERYLHAGCVPGQAYVFFNRERTAAEKDAISVSEGHGYGMLLTAFFAGHDPDARRLFDQLYAFFRAHPSSFTRDLMAWQQQRGCIDRKGEDDSASDGDLDIAFALLLAAAQWGNDGPIDYGGEARKVIAAIKAAEVNLEAKTMRRGDSPDDPEEANSARLSDVMPGHFRSFNQATGDSLWMGLVDRGYTMLTGLQAAHSPDAGLLPDFVLRVDSSAPAPAGSRFVESAYDGQFSYNACRCPMRIGIDYLTCGEPRAKAVLGRLNSFIQKKTGGAPGEIRDGYYLSGKAIHKDSSLAFTAPFAVAAMCDAANQEWLDALWHRIEKTPITEDDYYGNTIKLLCMVALSGNWWTP